MLALKPICAALWLCASTAAMADDDSICADRPSKATSACTVPDGHFQLETGLADWSLTNNGGERDTNLILGETTFKYGLTDRSDIELDVSPFVRVSSRSGGTHQGASGFGDILAMFKQQLTGKDAAVQVSALPFVKIPTASHRIGNGKWEAGFVLPVNYDIPKTKLGLNLSPELDWAADQDGSGHHLQMAQVASLGWQATDKLNLTAELWGQWDWDPAGSTRQYSADAAVAYTPRKDLQLDAGANLGLNRETPDVELYAGISKRF